MLNSLAERVRGFFKFVGKKSTEGMEDARKGSRAEGIEKTKSNAYKEFYKSPKVRINPPAKSLLRSPMSARTGGLLG